MIVFVTDTAPGRQNVLVGPAIGISRIKIGVRAERIGHIVHGGQSQNLRVAVLSGNGKFHLRVIQRTVVISGRIYS